MDKKKILIICYSFHHKEPRLLMQCAALKNNFDVTTAGFSSVTDKDIKFIMLSGKQKKAWFDFHRKFSFALRLPFTLLNKFQSLILEESFSYSKKDYNLIKKESFDLIICHHPSSLELAFKLKHYFNCKLVFNAHEIYSLEFEDDKEWMTRQHTVIDGLLKKFLSRCDYVFSINREICDFYERNYQARCLPILNSKRFYDLYPLSVKTPMQVIHHGGAMPQRRLEQMADAILSCKKKYELTFMLVNTNPEYLDSLKGKYQPLGIKFKESVPYENIIEEINKYDIGLYILPNGTINHDLALPNKLFEFVQARLAIITSPNTAMKNFVLKHKLGEVSEDFDALSMSRILGRLNEKDILEYKQNSHSSAAGLASSADENLLLDTIKKLLRPIEKEGNTK